jgi:hypothetical protein
MSKETFVICGICGKRERVCHEGLPHGWLNISGKYRQDFNESIKVHDIDIDVCSLACLLKIEEGDLISVLDGINTRKNR